MAQWRARSVDCKPLNTLRITLVLGMMAGVALRSFAQVTPVPGSPFTFGKSDPGSFTVHPSPDQKHLFVANTFSGRMSVLNADASGGLSFHGSYELYSGYNPSGMTTDPEGHWLFTINSGVGSLLTVQ